jgi:hypothetical protein
VIVANNSSARKLRDDDLAAHDATLPTEVAAI